MGSIWIQVDYTPIRSRDKYFHHIPKLAFEGVWLCFIKPISKLPRSMGQDPSELNAKINQADKSMPPHDLARSLGFNTWLNEQTWFEFAWFEFASDKCQGIG